MRHSKMHYAAILTLMLTATPALATSLVDKCLVGKWVPDMAKVSKSLRKLSDAPKSQVSGSVLMIIKARGASEFRVKNWSLMKIYSDSKRLDLRVSGKAKFTVSAPHGGEFHFAEQSNTYKQKLIDYKFGMANTFEVEPIWQMLPMGEWAHGTIKCSAKTLVFKVSDQDSDGNMFTVWHRK